MAFQSQSRFYPNYMIKKRIGRSQGGILSVTRFSIKNNSIIKCIHTGVECSLNVVDFVICFRAKDMNTSKKINYNLSLMGTILNSLKPRRLPYIVAGNGNSI